MQTDIELPPTVAQPSESNAQKGFISQEKHDTVVATLRAEIRALRENEERLLFLRLAWKKERNDLLKNAEVE